MKDKRVLSGGWRVSEPYSTPRQGEYAEQMAKEMRADPTYKKREATTNQTLSFFESIDREARGEARDWSAPLPDNVLAVKDAKTKDELVGERQFKILEMIKHVEAKHSSSDKRNIGKGIEHSASAERKEKAAHVFNVTPALKASEVDASEVVGIVKILSQPPPIELKAKKTVKEMGMSLWEKLTWKK